MDPSKTASPAEIVYTATLAFAFLLALANTIRRAKAMRRVIENRLQTGEDGAQWAIAADALEQSVLIAVVALALLCVGVIALYLPPNPASPSGISSGIAFLVAAAAIVLLIVRKWQWDTKLSKEIEKRRHT
jgi:protein-S-isoprenylcysteine O-methyltransferase Ste14